MNENFIKVDADKCIRCSYCIIDCPTCVLEMKENLPGVRENQCIACGHCVSVCPTEAIDNTHCPRTGQEAFDATKLPSKEEAAYFLRTRRSIRGFRNEPVPRETLEELLDLARTAPTGGNTQGVQFLIIQNKTTLNRVVDAAMAWATERLTLAPHLASMVAYHNASGKDNVLRDAPCLIVALMDEATTPMFRQNGRFMLTYAELYAPMLGLGSCWAGWAEAAAIAGDARMREVLALPAGKVVVGTIVAGFPLYQHKRIPSRNQLQITWAD